MWGGSLPHGPRSACAMAGVIARRFAVSVLDALPEGITGIDTYMGGASEITAGFLLAGDRPALIETGPAKVAGAIAAGVADAGLDPADPAWIGVAHIPLDPPRGGGAPARAVPAGAADPGRAPAALAWIVDTQLRRDPRGGVGDLVRTCPNATVVVRPA